MFMITMSAVFGYGVPIERMPQRATLLFSSMTDNPYVLMLMIIAFLVIVGMFMEGAIIIILTTPILLPLVQSYGYDPVVFGLILCTLSTVSNMTPPMGIAMFTVCNNLQCPLEDYIKACFPFLMVIVIGAIIYMFFPGLVLFVPNLIFG
jgi:TRAP-type C4-dicarboxylate transport system permease large subunit